MYRRGNFAKVLKVIYGNNTMEIAGQAKLFLKEYPQARIFIDVVGVGVGVLDA